MNFNKLIGNGYLERLVTDILYADLEAGKVDFLTATYKKLEIDWKRVTKVGKRSSKISSKAVNAVHEAVIDIIVEEMCQKRNEGLYKEFMDYYLKRFPDVKVEFDIFWDHVERWLQLYVDTSKEMEKAFVRRSFSLLYCLTYGKSEAVDNFCERWEMDYGKYYGNGRYNFYDQKKTAVKHEKWLDKVFPVSNFRRTQLFKGFVKRQIEVMANCDSVNPDVLVEAYVFGATHIIPATYNIRSFVNVADLECHIADELNIFEAMNNTYGKYHIKQKLSFYEKKDVYIDMFREIFEQMCMEEIDRRLHHCDSEEYDMDVMAEICEEEIEPESFYREAMLRFWFECYLMDQEKLYNEYYKNFSLDSSETDMEKLCKENNRLKDELERCRNKLQQYADADAERRKQQNQETKKENRQYNEKIASLQKQLDEQKKALEKQARTMEDMKEYIALVESANSIEPDSEIVDTSKIYQHRILFVGGRQETVTRLKSVFSTANFVANETMQIPQKTDTVVLMAENMNHALYYKYIGHAREKGIKVIYCNGTNIESITNQVVCNL